MKLNFDDLHIAVTGGAGALGTPVVQLLIDNGASCSVPCFNKNEWNAFTLKDHAQVFAQAGVDLSNESQTQSFYDAAVKEQGPLWASVHIAGGFAMGKIDDITKDDFMKQINMNLVSCFNSCKKAVSLMRKNGGRIVNVSSRPAVEPRQGAGRIPYITSKAGVAALTESLATEVVEDDILVNAIAPSTIDTPANRKSMPDADFSSWPKPTEIAAQILHLISEQNSIIRGAIVPVYGKA